jgi:hypothetical protein
MPSIPKLKISYIFCLNAQRMKEFEHTLTFLTFSPVCIIIQPINCWIPPRWSDVYLHMVLPTAWQCVCTGCLLYANGFWMARWMKAKTHPDLPDIYIPPRDWWNLGLHENLIDDSFWSDYTQPCLYHTYHYSDCLFCCPLMSNHSYMHWFAMHQC